MRPGSHRSVAVHPVSPVESMLGSRGHAMTPVSATLGRKPPLVGRSHHHRAQQDWDLPGGAIRSRSHTHTLCRRRGERSQASKARLSPPRIRGTEPPVELPVPVSKTRLCPFNPNTGGRGSHCAASIDQGPIRASPSAPRVAVEPTPPAQPGDIAQPQLGSPHLRCAHHAGRKGRRLHLCCGARGSEAPVNRDVGRKPSRLCSTGGG